MENLKNGTVVQSTSALIGAYHVEGTLGNVGLPGAPIMHFNLVVVPSKNSVSGSVEITQSIAPPNGLIFIKNVKGQIHSTGFGKVTQIVALEGDYTIGASEALIPFRAYMNLENNWTGSGSFTYGSHTVENVPVNKI